MVRRSAGGMRSGKARALLMSTATVVVVGLVFLASWSGSSPTQIPQVHALDAPAVEAPTDERRAAIDIVGDQALARVAADRGWPGSGRPDDPYRIRELRIFVDGQDGLRIEATRQHVFVTKNTIESVGRAAVRLVDVVNVTVHENTLLGDHAGVIVEGGHGVTVTANRIAGQESGIRLFAGRGHLAADNVLTGQRYAIRVEPDEQGHGVGHRLERNEVRDVDVPSDGPAAGIVLTGRAHRILDNRFERTADVGLWMLEAKDVLVQGNRFDGSGAKGLYMQRSEGGSIRGNMFAAYERAAIAIDASSGVQVRDNTVVASTAAAILMTTTHALEVHDNALHDTRQGIVAWADEGSTLRANRFERVERPVDLYDCVDTRITTNRIVGFAEAALSLRRCSEARIYANHLSDGQGTGIYGAESSLHLAENVLERTQGGVVLDAGTRAEVVRNILRGSGPTGLEVQRSEARLRDNHVVSYEVGIRATDATLDVRGGEVSYNRWGIVLYGASPYSSIQDVTMTGADAAVALLGVEAVSLEGNVVHANRFGLVLAGTHRADVASNRITDNDVGLLLDNVTQTVVWDNLFANTVDAKDRDVRIVGSTDTRWNVTKRDGQNILGGSHIGGNAWHDYQGADADLDGLGDTPYVHQPCRDPVEHPACTEDLAPFPLDLQPLVRLPVPDRVPDDEPQDGPRDAPRRRHQAAPALGSPLTIQVG